MLGQSRRVTIPWILATAIIIADTLILGATTWMLSTRDQVTEVTQAEILEGYRAERAKDFDAVAPIGIGRPRATPSELGALTPTPAPSDVATTEPPRTPTDPVAVASPSPAPSTRTPSTPGGYRQPQPGVYEYATSGSESVSMMGARHQYPSHTYASVQTGQSCNWRMQLTVVAEHVDEWRMCSDAGWLARVGHTRTITWFGVRTEGYYDCGEPLVQDSAEVVVGRTTTWRGCSDGSGSLADIDVTLLERGTFAVAGTKVPAIAVEVVMHSSGTTRGTSTDRYWLAIDTGLILQLDRNVDTTSDTHLGVVDYQEQVSFELTSLTPST